MIDEEPTVKVITINAVDATLLQIGAKSFVTRSWPYQGDMRPDGVAGSVGVSINAGDRVAIATFESTVVEATPIGGYEAWPADHPDERHPNHPEGRPVRLYVNEAPGWRGLASWIPIYPRCIVGSATIVGTYPILRSGNQTAQTPLTSEANCPNRVIDFGEDEGELPHQRGGLWVIGPRGLERIESEELRYDDWSPGRWAVELADYKPSTEQCPACGGTGGVGWIGDHASGMPYRICPFCWPKDPDNPERDWSAPPAQTDDGSPDDVWRKAGVGMCEPIPMRVNAMASWNWRPYPKVVTPWQD